MWSIYSESLSEAVKESGLGLKSLDSSFQVFHLQRCTLSKQPCESYSYWLIVAIELTEIRAEKTLPFAASS